MKSQHVLKAIGLASVAALALAGCAANEGGTSSSAAGSASATALSGTLNGIGSSAQSAAQTAWIAGYNGSQPDVTVNYDPQGSGAGRTAFISGAADFAGSDAALKDEELKSTFKACATGTAGIDLPVYISPIAVIFNVAGVKSLNLDATTVAKIFKGEITKWNDPAITALNAGVSLPSTAISTVHRSDDSGTTQNFTDYLAQAAPSVWNVDAAQAWPFKSGDGAQGTSGVVTAVKNGTGTIGYADESQAGSLGVASIKVGSEFQKPTADAAAAVVEASPLVTGREANDLAVTIDRKSTAAGTYPLVLVSYLIACQNYADPAKAALVKSYAGYLASAEGQTAGASAAGSAPLSASLQAKVAAAIATIK